MPEVSVDNINIKRLVSLLKDDVQRRGLRPGDRYMTASEACERFSVSEIAVHRAMQALAEQDYLVRRRGSGTFVGEKFKRPVDPRPPLSAVHVVLSMDHHRTATLPAELFVDRLYAALPGTTVEVHYVPEHASLQHLRRTVEEIGGAARRRAGFILIRSSRAMQIYIAEAGVPAVVFGGIYPGVEKLAWLDVDQPTTGRLMAQHLHERGHKRFGLILRDDWRPGDNELARAVARELGRAGHTADTLTIHSVPPDHEDIVAEVRAMLAAPEPPTAIMCRSHRYAAAVEEALSVLSSAAARRFDVVVGSGGEPASPRHACVAPLADETEQVETLARLLVATARGDDAEKRSVLLPVELREPDAAQRSSRKTP